MNSSFTNTLLVVILVLLVGFGVWYLTGNGAQKADTSSGPGIQLNVTGGADDGTSDQGPGDQ